RDLRRSLADPLMDVLHRVLATTGLEVELSASPQALAARRRARPPRDPGPVTRCVRWGDRLSRCV
ncbi:hypothetical protein ACFWUQ_12055, partial [Streptomyces sp. NPDC058662]|uniref:hypothetical protein n=1 Tax=Streptomyces sp. NPDC058662 TaxID=3346583 RepID=UPI0036479E1F